jgi:hypothetical protein
MENIPWAPHPRATMRLLDHDPLDKYRRRYPGEKGEQDDDSSRNSNSSYIGAPHPYSPVSPSSLRSDQDQEQETSSEDEDRVENFNLDAPHGTFDPGYEYEPQTDEERARVEENDINPGVVVVSIECSENIAAARRCLNTSCATHYGQMGVNRDWDDENCHYRGVEWEDEDKQEASGNEEVEANGGKQDEVDENDLDEIERYTDRDSEIEWRFSRQYLGSDPRWNQDSDHEIGEVMGDWCLAAEEEIRGRDWDEGEEGNDQNHSDGASSDYNPSGDTYHDGYPNTPRQLMDGGIEQGLVSESDSEGHGEESQGEDDTDNHKDDGNVDMRPPRKKQKRVHSRLPQVDEGYATYKYAPDQKENGKANKKEEEDDSESDEDAERNQKPTSPTEVDLEREVDLALLPESEQQPEQRDADSDNELSQKK